MPRVLSTHCAGILSFTSWARIFAVRAARNYRTLRGLGIKIRKTADIIIGTFCIENHHLLLHDDRDFLPMERHLGLMVA
jgi:hypothetical protein